MAGAASGMLNTVRQVGSVIGTAAVGALLQNRLVSSLSSQAAIASASLPAPVAVRSSAGSGRRPPADCSLAARRAPAPAARGASRRRSPRSCRLGAEVFAQGYVLAMRWTMVMPIAVVGLAAASCLAIKNKTGV